jgi:DNA-binding XRE family transcriptional regulator
LTQRARERCIDLPNSRGLPLVDPEVVGRRLRGARIVAGFDRVADSVAEVRNLGASLSERTLYAIERGEQLPTIEQYLALVMTYDLHGGMLYLAPAFRADVAEALKRAWRISDEQT